MSLQDYSLFDAIVGVWEWDIQTGELVWSDDTYRILGFSPGEVKPDFPLFLSMIHDDDRARVAAAIEATVKTSQAYNLVFRVCRKNADISVMHAKGQIIFKDKKARRLLGLCWDISEQYAIEQSIKKSNRAMQVLSGCNSLLLYTKNEEELIHGICDLIAESMEYRMVWVGYAEHDSEKSIKPMVHKGFEEGYLDDIKLSWADNEYGRGPTGIAIRTGQISIMQDIIGDPRYQQWRDAAQERGFCSSIALPLIHDKYTYGVLNIYAYEANAFDQNEVDLLQQLAGDLAFGINSIRSQNDMQLLNQQLQQAQKMEAIGQLTGGIAHDFNNILASILGFTNLALQRFVTKEQTELREYLEEVFHAGERARDLVSQLMVFSRTTDTQVAALQLAPVIKEVAKMLQATIPSRIQLNTSIEAGIPPVLVNPVKFQQLLMNLCINARDAIREQGQINIQVKTTRINTAIESGSAGLARYRVCQSCNKIIEAGNYVEISVQDTGEGIADDDLLHIFEPFYTTKDMDKGTGMGLSVSHGIVHQSGGHIWIDTELGKGSVFSILLPVETVENKAALEKITDTVVLDRKNRLNNARLLVVDDEASVARFMGDLLSGYGADVHVETHSQTALDVFSRHPEKFNLMITDQTMPELTGTELAKKILKIKPSMQIILCTGFSEGLNAEKAMSMGIKGYLSKPIEIKQMIELIEALLNE